MKNRYENFYKKDWQKAYGFWHKVITRGKYQVKILRDVVRGIDKEEINILDVGCGEGDETRKALSSIKNKKISIIASDTSREALKLYPKNNPQTIKIIQSRLEKLPSKISKRFDLILFSHCLYGVNLKGLFSKYIRLLNKNGIILIFLDSKESGIKNIQRRFWREVHKCSFDENTAEDIARELKKWKYKFKTIKFSNFMLLKVLEKIDKNGIGDLLIPFTFRAHEISKVVFGKILLYIKKIAVNKKINNKTFAIILEEN